MSDPDKAPYPLLGGPCHGKVVWMAGQPPSSVLVPNPDAKAANLAFYKLLGKVQQKLSAPPLITYQLVHFVYDAAELLYYECQEFDPDQRRRVLSCWMFAGYRQWLTSLVDKADGSESKEQVEDAN